MTNRETKQVLAELDLLKGLKGFNFLMAITDAKKRILEEHEVIDKLREPSEKFKEYQTAIEEVNKKFANLDKNGEAKIITETLSNGQQVSYYDIDPSKTKERIDAVKVVEKKFTKEIKEQEEKNKLYLDTLMEKSTLKPTNLNKEDIPDVTFEQMEVIRKLIFIVVPEK